MIRQDPRAYLNMEDWWAAHDAKYDGKYILSYREKGSIRPMESNWPRYYKSQYGTMSWDSTAKTVKSVSATTAASTDIYYDEAIYKGVYPAKRYTISAECKTLEAGDIILSCIEHDSTHAMLAEHTTTQAFSANTKARISANFKTNNNCEHLTLSLSIPSVQTTKDVDTLWWYSMSLKPGHITG